MENLDKYTQEEIKEFAVKYLKIKKSMNKYLTKYRATPKAKNRQRKASYYAYWKKKGVTPVPYEEMRKRLGRD
jgi:hypothetical protein|tara:strand:+ start:237 stop:455 length:219 start_codon:yes stop_codon:yes gene_type:complete